MSMSTSAKLAVDLGLAVRMLKTLTTLHQVDGRGNLVSLERALCDALILLNRMNEAERRPRALRPQSVRRPRVSASLDRRRR